jgi:hypothetical protein
MPFFGYTEKEIIEARLWESKHDCPIAYEGAIGGKTTFCFTPTSLGVILKVKCACGTEKDFTDYGSW